MASIELLILGTPLVRRDGQAVRLNRKTVALMAYLAVTDDAASRPSLATLLWPRSRQSQAATNLRKAVWSIRRRLGDEVLLDAGPSKHLRLSPAVTSDVDAFRADLLAVRQHEHVAEEPCLVCCGALERAVARYRDDLLAGFTLSDAPDFDDWQILHAERLRREAVRAFQQLVGLLTAVPDLEAAIEYAHRWLALDPLHEPAHRGLMALYTWVGRRTKALQQYERCVEVLQHELGVEPEPETIELHRAIRESRMLPPVGVMRPRAPPRDAGRAAPARERSDDSAATTPRRDEVVPSRADLPLDAAPQPQPAHERIRVAEETAVSRPDGGPREDLRRGLRTLLAAVLDEAMTVEMQPQELRAIARHAPADETAYRLGRVASWLLPRYALDTRFVSLTLLVDRGEEATGERWAVQEAVYNDLRAVLDDLSAPALVVTGAPGAGKSTLLRRLELDLAVETLRSGSGPMTFYVQLNGYREADASAERLTPSAWLAERWSRRYPLLPSLEALLDRGDIVLLLDGLNEIPHRGSAEYRRRVDEWKRFIHQTVCDRPSVRAVFTCRSLDYSTPLSTPELRVPQIRIEALSNKQVRAFLERECPRWCDEIWQALAGTPALELFRTPYLLTLLIAQAEATGTVPRDRAALFTDFVRRALRRELERGNRLFLPGPLLAERDVTRLIQTRTWPDPYELPERGPLFGQLATLAFRSQVGSPSTSSSQVRVDYDAACALIGGEHAARTLRAGEALGLLVEDTGADEVMFHHQLLQEYFAARALARTPDPSLVCVAWRVDDVEPSLDEVVASLAAGDPLPPPQSTGWEETATLAAAMTAEPEAFIDGLAATNLPLAGRCTARDEIRGRLSDETVDAVRCSLVERSRDPEADLRARIAAGLALGPLGDPRFKRGNGLDGDYLLPPLVEIAGGPYVIGSDEAVEPDEAPAHTVQLESFAIGRFSVTNAEWALFMASGGYDDERWWDTEAARAWQRGEGTADGSRHSMRYWVRLFREDPVLLERYRASGTLSEAMYEEHLERMRMTEDELEAHLREIRPGGRVTEPAVWRWSGGNNPSQPVSGVSWFEARAYCRWLAAQSGIPFRLPTEAEWEAAARGRDGRRFAFGDVLDPWRCNVLETHVRAPTPVGVFPDGDTPEGVSDLTGNTWDWTSSLYGMVYDEPDYPYPYRPDDGREDATAPSDVIRVARGGGWHGAGEAARAVNRLDTHPSSRHRSGGLRLACDAGHI